MEQAGTGQGIRILLKIPPPASCVTGAFQRSGINPHRWQTALLNPTCRDRIWIGELWSGSGEKSHQYTGCERSAGRYEIIPYHT